jgi:hypothetical protein
MSDDDQGRAPSQDPGDETPSMDETQPLTGPTSEPPPAPSSPYGAPAGPGAVPPPQNPYGPPAPQNPYGAQDPQAPYAPPPTNPYPQPGSFDQYGAQPYAAQQPYGTYPAGYGAGVPDHPSSTTAMVLGIVALVGLAVCGGLTLVLAPFAWAMGSRALREIDAEPGRYGGRDKANAGRIMGIIGTVLLAAGLLVIVVLVVGLVVASSSNGVTTYRTVPG